MKRHMRVSSVFLVAVVALFVGAAAPESRAQVIQFDEAEMFFEENSTDEDLGVQFFLDGEGWRRVIIFTPTWRRLVSVSARGSAGVIGLTELFSESAEPEFAELPREDFLALFPEGDYRFFGWTTEGDLLVGTTELTHDLPAPVVVASPEEDEVVPHDEDFVITWGLVADPDFPDSVIEAYQVIVEKDVEEERLRVLTADMAPGDTSFTVAPGFFEPDKDYKVEILAIETSGNKTITEVPFVTAPLVP